MDEKVEPPTKRNISELVRYLENKVRQIRKEQELKDNKDSSEKESGQEAEDGSPQ